jgi:hypothetical protein
MTSKSSGTQMVMQMSGELFRAEQIFSLIIIAVRIAVFDGPGIFNAPTTFKSKAWS